MERSPRGGDQGDDQRECERARRGLLRGVYGATRFMRWGGDSRAERSLRVARSLASAVASRRPWLGSESDDLILLGRPVAAFSRSRTLCWCSARSAHEGPPLVHSAHSLLSSFGILTTLPTHSSLSPSPLSFFSTDFVCQKRVSADTPENLLLPRKGQKLDLEFRFVSFRFHLSIRYLISFRFVFPQMHFTI